MASSIEVSDLCSIVYLYSPYHICSRLRLRRKYLIFLYPQHFSHENFQIASDEIRLLRPGLVVSVRIIFTKTFYYLMHEKFLL